MFGARRRQRVDVCAGAKAGAVIEAPLASAGSPRKSRAMCRCRCRGRAAPLWQQPPRRPRLNSARRSQARNDTPTLPGVDSRTAVYDISARTVYLPGGRKLEAHSGLGDKMDDPRYVAVKNRGPTPPNVYDLSLREQPFHGVRAIRLTPVDEGKMFGRDGMLAHSYMLGPERPVEWMRVVRRLSRLPARVPQGRGRSAGRRRASAEFAVARAHVASPRQRSICRERLLNCRRSSKAPDSLVTSPRSQMICLDIGHE